MCVLGLSVVFICFQTACSVDIAKGCVCSLNDKWVFGSLCVGLLIPFIFIGVIQCKFLISKIAIKDLEGMLQKKAKDESLLARLHDNNELAKMLVARMKSTKKPKL